MRITRITDLDHDSLADYARLTDVALRRVTEPEGGLYIAESSKVIERALRAGHVPRSVLMTERWLADIEPLVEGFEGEIFIGDAALLETLTGYHLHRGALAAMHRPELPAVKADQVIPWASEPRFSYAGSLPLLEGLAKTVQDAKKVS